MPTLINTYIDNEDSSLYRQGRSAHESDRNLNRQGIIMDGGAGAAGVIDHHDDDANDTMNATTLSDTMLEEVLHAMKIDREESHGRSESSENSREDIGPDDSTLTESRIIGYNLTAQRAVPFKTLAPSIQLQVQLKSPGRIPGPNETLYRQTFAHKVHQWIDRGRSRFPEAFRDYCSMNTPEKEREQDRVMKLLARLGVRRDLCSLETDAALVDRTQELSEKSVWFQDENGVEFENNHSDVNSRVSNSSAGSQIYDRDADDTMESVRDASAPLFSPPVKIQALPRTPASVRFASEAARYSDESSSTLSVEHARAASQFRSPAAVLQRKRLASMSGKRGSDQVRIRMDECSHDNVLSQDYFSGQDDSPRFVESPTKIMSTKGGFFSSSQSPIPIHLTHSPARAYYHHSSSESEGHVDVPLGDDSDDQQFGINDSASSHDSLIKTMYGYSQKNVAKPLRDTTRHNVRMKQGAVFHYNALQTAINKPYMHRDPLVGYVGNVGRRLNGAYERLYRRDQGPDGLSKAILLSMNNRQVQNLVLKLILSSSSAQVSPHNWVASQQSSGTVVEGQNLIVVRDREAIAEWSSDFREGSSFSVLDFLALPVKQRKSQSTTSKLAKYDIVLTTFDALKSPDVTFSIDSSGHVILHLIGCEQGWFESRGASQSSGQTKRLSVLHALKWLRVIFVDFVGRKGYVSKPETSRSVAATALNSPRRYICFLHSRDEVEGACSSKFLCSDQKTSSSLTSVLRLNSGDEKGYSVKQAIIDANKRKSKC
jgi:hypothetical protein